MRLVSFVIPCYGSEYTLEKVIDEIEETISVKDAYEIILINDHSKDHVWETIKKLAREKDNIVGIDLTRNFGQHAALMAGYCQAKGDIIVSLDDDGQTPVDEVYKLIDKLNEGYDAVYARYYKKMQNPLRNLGSKIASWMSRVMIGRPKDVTGCSYFVMRRYIMEEVLRYKNCYPYVFGLVIRATNNVANVYVNHRKRLMGKSGYSMSKLLNLWMNGYTSFSVKPLRMAGMIGYFLTGLGFVAMIIMFIRKLLNPDIAIGWSSVMIVEIFIGSVILITLGIVGEYIGRIFICINSSPQYVVKELIDRRKHVQQIEKGENIESISH